LGERRLNKSQQKGAPTADGNPALERAAPQSRRRRRRRRRRRISGQKRRELKIGSIQSGGPLQNRV
jgi:hypothetical protein